EKGLTKDFQQESVVYRDGADGKEGGVGILRTSKGRGELCAVFKYSAHGMGHGHFDKLSYSLYDELGEIAQDYGAARWVNIDQKGGGRYLPENKTFAKQSIAHNTLTINETSHYEGDIKKGEAHHPDPYYFNASDEHIQIVSAKERHAYPGSEMHRTLVLMKDESFEYPLLVDVFKVRSRDDNQYDLPIWFQGHLLQTDFEYKAALDALTPLGQGDGYQHIWKEAVGTPQGNNARLTWFNQGRFYSMTSWVEATDELILARSGANDPHFNIRHDPVFIIRKKQAQNALFLSVIEPHGSYNPVAEIPNTPFSSIASVALIHDSDTHTLIRLEHKNGRQWVLMLAHEDANEESHHSLRVDEEDYQWQGPFELKKLNQ
ncbi:MAG: heparinase II/III family protein, partial [Bacteroidota bacterium]